MNSNTVYLYNFSGVVTPPISIQWGTDGVPANSSFYGHTLNPTTNTSPWAFENIPRGYNTYTLMYNNDGFVSDGGTGFPLVFNRLGETFVYVLNDPNVVLPDGMATDYYSTGSGVDTAFIINGNYYQYANTYPFPNPSPYLAFSVPAVSTSVMQQLSLVTDAFANDTIGKVSASPVNRRALSLPNGNLPSFPNGNLPSFPNGNPHSFPNGNPPSFPNPDGKFRNAAEAYIKSNQVPASTTNYWYWIVAVIIVLIVLLILGGGTYYLLKK